MIDLDRATNWTHIEQVLTCLTCGAESRRRLSQADFLKPYRTCPYCRSGWVKTRGDESTLEWPDGGPKGPRRADGTPIREGGE